MQRVSKLMSEKAEAQLWNPWSLKYPTVIPRIRRKLWIWRPTSEWVLEGSNPSFAFSAMSIITSSAVFASDHIAIVYVGHYHFVEPLKCGNSSD